MITLPRFDRLVERLNLSRLRLPFEQNSLVPTALLCIFGKTVAIFKSVMFGDCVRLCART